MRSRVQTLAVLMAALLATGCAATSNSSAPHEQCLVCKHNADLACVDLTVSDDTPRAEYEGKTYYFCSDECRDEFVKNPAKYVSK